MDFYLFLGAAMVLAITPGPGIAYVLARTVRGGRPEGIASAIGTSIGGMVHVLIAAAGLSALIAASPFWFTAIKYLGAVYLVYLGVRMILDARRRPGVVAPAAEAALSRVVVEGIVVEATNVKTALFFLAFIPQFVDPQASVASQFMLLGTCVVVLNTLVDVVVVTLAGWLSPRLANGRGAVLNGVLSGGVMVALGLFLALSDARSLVAAKN